MHNEIQIKRSNELKVIFDEFIDECQFVRRLRPQTIKNYQDVFSTFQKVMPEVLQLDDLNHTVVHQFFKEIGRRQRPVGNNQVQIGVKPSTTHTYYNRLLAFFRWLETHNHIPTGSLSERIAKPPQPKYTDERALSDEEIAQIISAITLHQIDNNFALQRDLLMVYLLLYTGIRRGELLGLRVADVNLLQSTLFIDGATSKSKTNRIIPIHDKLHRQLKQYLHTRKQLGLNHPALILSTKQDAPLTTFGLRHWVAKYSRLSGVSFHVHRFRHSFACNLAKTNADIVSIMKVMGHHSIKMTERYLRSINTVGARSFIDKL